MFPINIILQNLKNFLKIIQISIFKKIPIYIIYDSKIIPINEVKKKFYKKKIKVTIVVENLKRHILLKYVNSKTNIIFSPVSSLIDLDKNFYPIFFNYKNPINSFLYFTLIKQFCFSNINVVNSNKLRSFYNNFFFFKKTFNFYYK